MAANLTNVGEEWAQKQIIEQHSKTSWSIGLYDDSTDSITDSKDETDISTEPDNANDYARKTVTVPDNVTVTGSSDVQFDVSDQTFSVGTNTETVDSWFIVVSFTSDTANGNSEGTDNDHLVITGALSSSKDLTDIDNLTIQDIGGTLD